MSALKKIAYKILGPQNIKKIQYEISFKYNNQFSKLKNTKKIFYMLIPTHGNLGDQAIAYASKKFLMEKFKDYEIIEVNCEDTYKYSKAIKKSMNNDDLIFLHGGGNMGNHYIHEEEARRHIIDKFKDNKIVSFTQTIYFSNDSVGKIELNKTKQVYNSHPNLTIIAREDKSYEVMKSEFKNANIIKCPDIVFYLNTKLNLEQLNRKNIMTCLRKDKETYVDLGSKQEFINQIKSNYDDVVISDTVINKSVYKDDREVTLLNLWKKFYESKVVITDRLHGMIFCAITKTPCIVTRSLDHKVVESYKWIKDLNYIRMVDRLNYKEIKPIIEELSNLEEIDEFDFDKDYFLKLDDYIK